MDPKATLERIREAYISNDYAEGAEACADLLAWITKGGSVDGMDESQLSALVHMSQIYFISQRCRIAR